MKQTIGASAISVCACGGVKGKGTHPLSQGCIYQEGMSPFEIGTNTIQAWILDAWVVFFIYNA